MIIGITGKIASGKSRLMKEYEDRGFYCIYADKIVHDLYKNDEAGAKVIETVFGKKFLNEDGSVNRVKLRDVVFNDENKLKLLNDVIHPLVYEEIQNLVNRHKNRDIAIESIYFDPNFLEDFVDKVVVTERSHEDIVKSLMEERGFTKEMAERAWGML